MIDICQHCYSNYIDLLLINIDNNDIAHVIVDMSPFTCSEAVVNLIDNAYDYD